MDRNQSFTFGSWCTRTFETIAKQFGGLLDIDRKTETFSVLFEAKIRVNAKGVSSIWQTVSFEVEDNWIPIQLIPLFTMEDFLLMVKKQKETPTKRNTIVVQQPTPGMNLHNREAAKSESMLSTIEYPQNLLGPLPLIPYRLVDPRNR